VALVPRAGFSINDRVPQVPGVGTWDSPKPGASGSCLNPLASACAPRVSGFATWDTPRPRRRRARLSRRRESRPRVKLCASNARNRGNNPAQRSPGMVATRRVATIPPMCSQYHGPRHFVLLPAWIRLSVLLLVGYASNQLVQPVFPISAPFKVQKWSPMESQLGVGAPGSRAFGYLGSLHRSPDPGSGPKFQPKCI